MSLVVFGSAKGSPGATTLVAALGGVWPPARRVLLAELDPAGGDLGIRLGLAAEPGLVTLAAEGRRRLTPELVWEHTAPFRGSDTAHVLAGPASADQATAALAALGDGLGGVLARLDQTDVLADCGRLDPGSPALSLVALADLVVLVARPSVAEVRHLSARVPALRLDVPVVLVVVGDRPYGVAEVATAVGVEGLGVVAYDERGAELVGGGVPGRSRLARTSALLRTTHGVAGALVARLPAPAEAPSLAVRAPSPLPEPPPLPAAPSMAPAPRAPVPPSPAPLPRSGEPTAAVRAPSPLPERPWATVPPAAEPDGIPDPTDPVPGRPTQGPAGRPGGRRPPSGRPRRTRPLQPRSRPPGQPREDDVGSDAQDGGGSR